MAILEAYFSKTRWLLETPPLIVIVKGQVWNMNNMKCSRSSLPKRVSIRVDNLVSILSLLLSFPFLPLAASQGRNGGGPFFSFFSVTHPLGKEESSFFAKKRGRLCQNLFSHKSVPHVEKTSLDTFQNLPINAKKGWLFSIFTSYFGRMVVLSQFPKYKCIQNGFSIL